MATPLDSIDPLRCTVGYGQYGRWGDLGYEGSRVTVAGVTSASALSTHAPARILFDVGGRFSRFTCRVALNDDVPPGSSHANFTVRADGTIVAEAAGVRPGDVRPLVAEISGARLLELTVTTSQWALCHAVWVDPALDAIVAPAPDVEAITDPLERAVLAPAQAGPSVGRCIATVVSPGFERWGDDLLGSVVANGNCPDARLVVLALDGDAACADLAAKYNALYVPCRTLRPVGPASKAVLYSIARLVHAEGYVCLDADMLVLDDLSPLFAALDAMPPGSILACREGNAAGLANLYQALDLAYGGGSPPFFQRPSAIGDYPLVVNDGLFAGHRDALLALDAEMRTLPGAAAWVDEHSVIRWRNQFVFNVAAARLGSLVELDPTWNVQLHVQDVDAGGSSVRPAAHWQGRPVHVLHYSGAGKHKQAELRRRCAAPPDPVIGAGAGGDAYGDFVRVLRAWLGRNGLRALTWSFYGTADGQSARVRDPGTFPLLATLHHLVRSNGAVRVLETGTARGVSAACLASAVAHRNGAKVVSFDPTPDAGCQALWDELPFEMAACIEQRRVDSIAGLYAALADGERYDAALLDSVHTADHLWAELEVVVQLVCEGGLILCHDPTLPGATVDVALRRLEATGYGVTRIWTATSGEREDDGLGLAVIENRIRADHRSTSSLACE
jgi:predicted O-methyltransferase YrrM